MNWFKKIAFALQLVAVLCMVGHYMIPHHHHATRDACTQEATHHCCDHSSDSDAQTTVSHVNDCSGSHQHHLLHCHASHSLEPKKQITKLFVAVLTTFFVELPKEQIKQYNTFWDDQDIVPPEINTSYLRGPPAFLT